MAHMTTDLNTDSKTNSKTKLMKDLFRQYNIHYNDNIMNIYERWLKNNNPTGNRYQKMCRFLNRYVEEKEESEQSESEQSESEQMKESEESDYELSDDLEDLEEIEDDQYAKKTMLMKYLFNKKFLNFSDDVMLKYYIWEKDKTGNRYQKMCRFIDSLDKNT